MFRLILVGAAAVLRSSANQRERVKMWNTRFVPEDLSQKSSTSLHFQRKAARKCCIKVKIILMEHNIYCQSRACSNGAHMSSY